MALTLFACSGGHVALPECGSLLSSREHGGNLVVNPPRPVWERSELTPLELTHWAFLVAAAGRAMIDHLPQLEGGCVNYWEAGNWALNDQAEPKGRKIARAHRNVHLHLLGRNPRSTDPAWRWGESPRFPDFSERNAYGAGYVRLTPEECQGVVSGMEDTLRNVYGMSAGDITPWAVCQSCGYSSLIENREAPHLCAECR